MAKHLRAKKTQILDAYNDFFNHIKFRKGWAEAPFQQSQVQPLLEEAAGYVAEIRSRLDAVNPEIKLRLVDGAAREYLWSVDFCPLQFAHKFVDGLVHASFKDANGYVENLSEQQIDQYLHEIRDRSAHREEELTPKDSYAVLKQRWQEVSMVMEAVLASHQDHSESQRQAEEPHLYQTLHLVTRLHRALRALQQEQCHELAGTHPLGPIREVTSEIASPVPVSSPEETLKAEDSITRNSELSVSEISSDAELPQVESQAEHRSETQSSDPAPSATSMDDAEAGVPPEFVTPDATPVEATEAQPTGAEAQQGESLDTQSTEAQPAMDTDDEPPPTVERTNSQVAAEIKINKIAEEVSHIREDLAQIQIKTDLLNAEMMEENAQVSPTVKKDVQKLSRACLGHSEALMRDLLALDDMHGTHIKPLRKSQVTDIQSLLDNVDEIQNRIVRMTNALREREEEEQREQEKHAKELEEEKKKFVSSKVGSLRESFAKMKLEPKFQVQQTNKEYIISAHIPGMDKDSINLEHGEGVLTMCGQRLPTEEEEAALWRELCDKHPDYASMDPSEQNKFVFVSGSGRFGTFKERQRLPADANPEGISATYQGGTLSLTVPRRVIHRHPHHTRQRPQYSPFGASPFYQNSDFWW